MIDFQFFKLKTLTGIIFMGNLATTNFVSKWTTTIECGNGKRKRNITWLENNYYVAVKIC